MNSRVRTDRQSVLRNTAASWLGFALQAATNFVLIPILVHGLGDRDYGAWGLLQATAAYLVLLELNVSDAVIRYIARYRAMQDHTSSARLYSTALCLFMCSAGAAGLVTFALCMADVPLGFAPEQADKVRLALAILGTAVALSLPLRVFPAILEGLGRYPSLNAVETAVVLFRSLLLAWVVTRGDGLVSMALVAAALLVVQGLVMAWLVRAVLPGLRFCLADVDRTTLKQIFAYASPALLIVLASQLSLHSDAFVIATYMDAQSITYFVLAAGLVDQVRRALMALATVLTPTVSVLDSMAGGATRLTDIFLQFAASLAAIAFPASIGAWLLGHAFLSLWVGATYADAGYLPLGILATALPWFAIQAATARVLFGLGKLRFLAAVSIAEAVANVGLSIALLGSLGIVGVALGTALPAMVQTMVTFTYTCRSLRIQMRRAIAAIGIPMLLAAPLPAAVWWGASTLIPLESWRGFVLASISGLLVAIPVGVRVLLGRPLSLRR